MQYAEAQSSITTANRGAAGVYKTWSFGTLKAPKLQLPRHQTLISSLAYCRTLQHLETDNKEPLLTPVCKLQKLLAPISKLRQVQHLLATYLEEPLLAPISKLRQVQHSLATKFKEHLLLLNQRALQLLEASVKEHRLWLKRRHFQLLTAQ